MHAHEIVDFLKLAITALRLNKMRSALTALGIIIGVASVIVMQAIGAGASKALQQQLSGLGTRVVTVFPGNMRVGGRSMGLGGATPMSEKDLRMLRESVPEIVSASGELNGSVYIVSGAANWSTNVRGVYAEYLDVRPWPLKYGRFFTADEVRTGAKVVVLGSSVTRELFGEGIDVTGETVRINNIPFEIIGVLSTRGASGMQDQDDIAFAPITTARSRLVGRRFATVPDTIGVIQTRIAEGYDIDQAIAEITAVMRKQRRIAANADDDFSVRNVKDLLQTANAQQETLKYLLATTAAMSLIVGGIGIMNIMLVSVTERTREIGLRMAVGARGIDVLAQFLTEAIILCLAGGLIGLLIGIAVVVAISKLAGWTVSVGLGTVLLAVIASGAVGIVFGFVPARRASALNPIDALRYE